MISLEQFTLSRGTKLLFENVSLTLHRAEKVGLIGANGAGKSSLFSVLLGKIEPDLGEVNLPTNGSIAHVAQETPAVSRSALDYAIDGDTQLRAVEADIAAAEAADDGIAQALGHAAFAELDGYTAPSRAEALLLGLGFSQEQFHEPVAHFSGGWRMRLNLAQALMCPSELLLLDEPTNHLDLDAILWLEAWLRRYTGTLVIISHDREFLDAVCQTIVSIEDRQLKRYGGNYSKFEILRAQQRSLQQSQFEKQQKHRAHLQSFIDRFKAKATKARQAQSRIKALEKMQDIAAVRDASAFTFQFRTPLQAPNPMITMEGVSCGYPASEETRDAQPTIILEGINLSIQNGERIGLLGANGQGKSTFIKALAGVSPILGGVLNRGRGLKIGYFAQHQLDTLDPNESPLQHLTRLSPTYVREQELRDFLGSFRFIGDMATSPIGPLSGGEKSRLALAILLWQRPNLLLLDEPTNHLDLETRDAMTDALAQFEGTLIVVSHDRHLLNATADHFFLIGRGRVVPFDGDLEDYRRMLLSAPASSSTPKNSAPPIASKAPAKIAPSARSQAAQQRKLTELEKKMEKLNAEKTRLETFFADPQHYNLPHPPEWETACKRQVEVSAELERIEQAWLETQESMG